MRVRLGNSGMLVSLNSLLFGFQLCMYILDYFAFERVVSIQRVSVRYVMNELYDCPLNFENTILPVAFLWILKCKISVKMFFDDITWILRFMKINFYRFTFFIGSIDRSTTFYAAEGYARKGIKRD